MDTEAMDEFKSKFGNPETNDGPRQDWEKKR